MESAGTQTERGCRLCAADSSGDTGRRKGKLPYGQGNGSEQGVEAVASVCTLRAALSMYLTDSWVVIDLEFEDDTDPDLVRMTEVCRAYDERMHERCGNICEGESLVVSVTQLGEYESFLVGIDGAWGLRPAETERGCSVIRFIFEQEKTGVYEPDDAAKIPETA